MAASCARATPQALDNAGRDGNVPSAMMSPDHHSRRISAADAATGCIFGLALGGVWVRFAAGGVIE
jgi:hypothetical protein